jgi:hypothetical protein
MMFVYGRRVARSSAADRLASNKATLLAHAEVNGQLSNRLPGLW